MGAFFEQLLTILVTTPGSLAYHLITIFSMVMGLMVCVNHWRASGFPQAARASRGMAWLLGLQAILLAAALLAYIGVLAMPYALPPLDRIVGLLSVVAIIWLWGFPEPSRPGDAATLLLSLFIGVGMIPAILLWQTESGQMPFNASGLDQAAGWLGLALSLAGCLLLALRRPNGWGLGLGMLTLTAMGYLGSLSFAYQPTADYAGALRLVQLAAYPLLLGLPMRFPGVIERQEDKAVSPAQKGLIAEKRRYNSDPRLIQEFLHLVSNTIPGKACDGLSKVISQMMVADLCFMVSMPADSKQLNVSCGYDLIRQQSIEGFSIDERLSPIISSALRRNRSVRLPASSTSPDLLGFANVLGIGRVGHMLVVPFPVEDKINLMGIVLLSPYSHRGWTNDDQANLNQIASLMARILHQNQPSAAMRQELEQAQQALAAARKQITELRQEKEALLNRSAQTPATAAIAALGQGRFSNSETEQLKEQLRLTLEELARLQAENQQIKLNVQQSSNNSLSEVTQLEEQLRISLEEITRLNERLFEADQRLMELQRARPTDAASPENDAVIAAMAQELRQPLFSIIGYTDLLLGESVGLLGASQRKFIERVKIASERLGTLVEDLVRITLNETPSHHSESVDLGAAIDEALTAAVVQIREKNIALRLELPEQLPHIYADRDALQQILIHLLQNAGLASPVDGEISLHAHIEEGDQNAHFVLIRVADSGEGIPQDELPRVFSRLYKADNPLIPGVGDTGVGLSIVKSLVEAQKGRIWVDSQKGHGSMFSVLLPVSAPSLTGGNGNGARGKV
jgi:signal transduction histidine kinase